MPRRPLAVADARDAIWHGYGTHCQPQLGRAVGSFAEESGTARGGHSRTNWDENRGSLWRNSLEMRLIIRERLGK
jgi:hypothetical protein